MFDDIHPNLLGELSTYALVRMGVRNIVVACLPAGEYGTASAAIRMLSSLSLYGSA
jgi:hypothetical protein